jgi:hypothetical protein
MKALHIFVAVSFAVGLSTVANAQYAQNAQGDVLVPTNLNPPGFVPVNGLIVSGVTFTDTAGADYDAGNGGNLTWTQDPVIEGNTAGETLSFTFPNAVTDFQFTTALSTQGTVANAVMVTILGLDAINFCDVHLGTYSATFGQQANDNFTNGIFVSPNNIGPICGASVTFNTGAASAFGFTKLSFSLYNFLYSALVGW